MKNVFLYTCIFLSFTIACIKESVCIDNSLIDSDALCFDVREPLCGCYDKTYSNECEATKKGVTSFRQGKCIF